MIYIEAPPTGKQSDKPANPRRLRCERLQRHLLVRLWNLTAYVTSFTAFSSVTDITLARLSPASGHKAQLTAPADAKHRGFRSPTWVTALRSPGAGLETFARVISVR